jgi:hypothetical protein
MFRNVVDVLDSNSLKVVGGVGCCTKGISLKFLVKEKQV